MPSPRFQRRKHDGTIGPSWFPHFRPRTPKRPFSSPQEDPIVPPPDDVVPTWTFSEQIFFSQDDEDITVNESGDDMDMDPETPQLTTRATHDSDFPSLSSLPLFPETADARDDDTCNNTMTEKVKQRGKKAVRASTVGAFVTFLKALFGIGMLSNPAVLGEVGLLLGTFCHLFIIVGCAFACYLLLTARQLAVNEVRARERKEVEEIEEYNESLRRRVVRERGWNETEQFQHSSSKAEAAPPLMTSVITTPKGWTGCHKPLYQASEVLSPASNCTETCDVDPDVTIIGASYSSSNSVSTPQLPQPVHTYVDTSFLRAGPSTNALDRIESTGKMSESEASTTYHNNIAAGSRAFSISDSYHRFEDRKAYGAPCPSPPVMPPRKKSEQVRLVTYGDVAKYLAGPTFAQLIIFTIVCVHLMFASGMLHIAVENLCYIAGWDRLGFSYADVMVTGADDFYGEGYFGEGRRRLGPSEDGNKNEGPSGDHDSQDNQQSRDNQEEWHEYNIQEAVEEYSKWEGPDFIGRLAMSCLLFPIIHGLLQIPSLKELASISSMGLVTYAIGCIGSMVYSAFVLSEGHPFLDRPDDIFHFKWSGIPTYVATTIYAIEGINLALPTVNSLEGSERAGWRGHLLRRKSTTSLSNIDGEEGNAIYLVVAAVFCYGVVTLFVSWMGLAGGLGGGIGTIHEDEGCRDVTYCLNSVKVQYVYMLSLGVALVLTLPVILYPSTQMLEIWLDEREDERRRKLEAEMRSNQIHSPETLSTQQLKSIRRHIRTKSLMDDETISVADHYPRELYCVNPPHHAHDHVMKTPNRPNSVTSVYSPPNYSPKSPNIPVIVESFEATNSERAVAEKIERKIKAKRKLKYWKLRMFLAFLICVIGTLEGSFPQLVKAAEVIRGVGLSMAGLISPPLLYMSAVGGRFSAGMASAMALLIGLGLFNMALVMMSAFGGKDYIIEEGPGHYHDSFYELDDMY